MNNNLLRVFPFNFCPKNCQAQRIFTDRTVMYNDDGRTIINTIHCEHEEACKMWDDRLDIYRQTMFV